VRLVIVVQEDVDVAWQGANGAAREEVRMQSCEEDGNPASASLLSAVVPISIAWARSRHNGGLQRLRSVDKEPGHVPTAAGSPAMAPPWLPVPGESGSSGSSRMKVHSAREGDGGHVG